VLPIGRDVLAAVHAVNNAHATELSWLELDDLASLLGQAFCARRIGTLDAFLLAFDETANMRAPTTGGSATGTSISCTSIVWSSLLRREDGVTPVCCVPTSFTEATHAGHDRLVCEVNVDPPNPASDAFHGRLGFIEVGRQTIEARGKTVRYLSRSLRA
jgi:predicted GNAT superfamily acetyltransferase